MFPPTCVWSNAILLWIMSAELKEVEKKKNKWLLAFLSMFLKQRKGALCYQPFLGSLHGSWHFSTMNRSAYGRTTGN